MESGKAMFIAVLLFLGSVTLGFVAMLDFSDDSNSSDDILLESDPLIHYEGD